MPRLLDFRHENAALGNRLRPNRVEPLPPSRVYLWLIVESRFSGIELATIDGRAIATGPAISDPGDDKQLVLAVPTLAPGRYRVSWHVISVDTHRTEGDFTFTVGP